METENKPNILTYIFLILLLPVILPTVIITFFARVIWFFAVYTWNSKYLK